MLRKERNVRQTQGEAPCFGHEIRRSWLWRRGSDWPAESTARAPEANGLAEYFWTSAQVHIPALSKKGQYLKRGCATLCAYVVLQNECLASVAASHRLFVRSWRFRAARACLPLRHLPHAGTPPSTHDARHGRNKLFI